MQRFRIYVVGAKTYLTIEHPAESAEDLYLAGSRAGFISAAAMERSGRRRNILIPFGNIAVIAEGEDQGPRMRQASTPDLRRLS
jgi:hypothetical protein